MQKIVGIMGSGRQAQETAEYLMDDGYKIAFFFCEAKYKDKVDINDIAPIVTEKDNLDDYKAIKVISAVGSPSTRKRLMGIWPHKQYMSFVHSSCWVSSTAQIGNNVMVAPKAVITSNAKIGDNCQINCGATINHDVEINEYCTVSPGVNIAGKVLVELGSYIGIGAVISDGVTIGEGALCGAGSVCVSDIPKLATAVGVPAKVIKIRSEWS